MKPTGMVRRIDDLGRVVIPKEIRRQLGLHEGDPVEIYYNDTDVCFRKYSPLGALPQSMLLNIVNSYPRLVILDENENLLAKNSTLWTPEEDSIYQEWVEDLTKKPIAVNGDQFGWVGYSGSNEKMDVVIDYIAKLLSKEME